MLRDRTITPSLTVKCYPTLEVVNAKNTSIVWDELFPTDEDAYAEFERTVAEEGMRTFLDSGKVIPFPR